VVRDRLARAGGGDCEALVEQALRSLGDRLTVARRDFSHARQTLAAQARLAEEPHGRAARRLCQRDSFREALEVRRLVGPLVEPEDEAALLRWRELAEQTRSHGEPGTRRRRRRRRGGRRRSLSRDGGDGKEAASPPPSGSSSAPAPPPPPTE
jgi:hypothetical protein